MPHELRHGPHLVILDGPTPIGPPVPVWRKHVRLPPAGPPLSPETARAASRAAWASWCDEHRYPEGLRAAVALAIDRGAYWSAGKVGGHRVRVEGAGPDDLGLRLAGARYNAGEWVWVP